MRITILFLDHCMLSDRTRVIKLLFLVSNNSSCGFVVILYNEYASVLSDNRYMQRSRNNTVSF